MGGGSKFFHGSSQALAHSAAKWVTVYPLSQLRVLMCESVYVESVNVLCVSALRHPFKALNISKAFSLRFSVSHTSINHY